MLALLLPGLLMPGIICLAQDTYKLKDPGEGHIFLNKGWKYNVGEMEPMPPLKKTMKVHKKLESWQTLLYLGAIHLQKTLHI